MNRSDLIDKLATTADVTKAEATLQLELNMIDIPINGLKEYVVCLANKHGITYRKTPYDDLAEIITKLSGNAVELDEVELLLIALERAGIIESKYIVPLHVNYLREKLNDDRVMDII